MVSFWRERSKGPSFRNNSMSHSKHTVLLTVGAQWRFVKWMKKERNIWDMVYLNSCNITPLFTHSYLSILILECPLTHTSYINIHIEGSLGLSPQMCASVSVACASACPGRWKNKQALPNWGSHLQLLPLLLAESPYLKQTELEAAIQVVAISKFS